MFIYQAQHLLYTGETKPTKTTLLQIRTLLPGKERHADK